MAKFTLFDGSNYLRREYEKPHTDSGMRHVVRSLRTEIARQTCIFVFDGAHANDYRKAIYPAYKGRRQQASDAFYEQVRAFERIVKHLNMWSIRVPYYEADDIIGWYAKTLLAKGADGIHIKSTDHDFQQIDGVSIEGNRLDVPSDQIILYKTLVGDVSDNIKGVPGFGEKAWAVLDKEDALAWQTKEFAPTSRPKLKPAVEAWCIENQSLLQDMAQVCEFRDVPEELITKYASYGRDNPDEVEKILGEYLA